jgi:hypothetical protein
MRNSIRALLAACSAALLLAAPAHATEVAGHFRVAISSAASTADFSLTPARRDFVILQQWESERARQLKLANPNLKTLMYQNLSGLTSRDERGYGSTGVSTQEADANPAWYLRNTDGQRFTFKYYDWIYAADIGDAAYQRRWADNVLAKLAAGPWDGVFMDDTNPTITGHYDPARVAKYPTDAQYAAATGSALASIGPRLRAAGKLVIPNFGRWRAYRSTVDPWLDHVSGAMDEMFGKWGDTTPDVGFIVGNEWKRQLGEIALAESKGKYFLGVSHSLNTDARAARYGWATLLLAAAGRSRFTHHGDYVNETWFPEYELPIGEPTGASTEDASGVHRRAFTNGLVVVNPTTAAVTVSFGGSYSGSGLSAATGATMPSGSALVLTRDGSAPTAPAEPTALAPTEPAPTEPAPTDPTDSGSVEVRVKCRSRRNCSDRLLLRAEDSGNTLGRRTVRVKAGRTVRVSVRLNAYGRRLVARRGRVALRVVRRALRPAAARAAVAPRRVTLRLR